MGKLTCWHWKESGLGLASVKSEYEKLRKEALVHFLRLQNANTDFIYRLCLSVIGVSDVPADKSSSGLCEEEEEEESTFLGTQSAYIAWREISSTTTSV